MGKAEHGILSQVNLKLHKQVELLQEETEKGETKRSAFASAVSSHEEEIETLKRTVKGKVSALDEMEEEKRQFAKRAAHLNHEVETLKQEVAEKESFNVELKAKATKYEEDLK